MKKIINAFLISLFVFIGFTNIASADTKVNVYMFGREGCTFCHAEEVFLQKLSEKRDDFNLVYFDVNQIDSKQKFNQITDLYGLTKATPVTLVGSSVIQGFNSEETTGVLISNAINKFKSQEPISFEKYLDKNSDVFSLENATCDGEEGSTSCTVQVAPETQIKVPFLGVIDFKDFSLFSMSVILGFVDGFNPCAMWVLLAFLLVLWQVGDKKKMFQVAGLFIFAETVMYWLILNFWFKAWDFVGLDKVVTPLVGVLAIVGGVYFLYRYYKDKDQLTCDVTSIEYKSKTEQKIRNIIARPMTIITALGIIGLAFSINMIEFACSIGIPQAFTKILEINNLNLFSQQMYILIYTFFYMIDDFVVFGLALYGFDKFYSVGKKYSNLSSLIGGVLMLILGALLLFNPSALVF